MIVKTIILDPGGTGFYISASRWQDATHAFRTRRRVCNHSSTTLCNCKAFIDAHDWRWIGERGWFGTDDNKRVYEALDTAIDLNGWHDGEFMEVEIEV